MQVSPVSQNLMRKLFDNGDFEELFRRHLGWDNPPEGLTRVDLGGGVTESALDRCRLLRGRREP